jgi:hypothetical protein
MLEAVNVAASAWVDFGPAAQGFEEQVRNAVVTALPIGGPIVALFVGWRIVRHFVESSLEGGDNYGLDGHEDSDGCTTA